MKASLLLVAWIAVAPTAALAYARSAAPVTGVCLYLPTREVPWSAATPLGSSLPEIGALAAIRRSFAVWEAETCSDLSFVERPRVGPTTGFEPRGSNVTTVVFRDVRCADVVPAGHGCWQEASCANEFNCWDGDARQIALTTTTFSACTGEIQDSDIELNAAGFRFTIANGPRCGGVSYDDCVDTDLENTLVHEIGHMIGLDHVSDAESTMYASAPGGEIKKRDLAEDDRSAICAIYPAGQPTVTCEPAADCPGGGESSPSGCGVPGAPGASGLLAVLLASFLRRWT